MKDDDKTVSVVVSFGMSHWRIHLAGEQVQHEPRNNVYGRAQDIERSPIFALLVLWFIDSDIIDRVIDGQLGLKIHQIACLRDTTTSYRTLHITKSCIRTTPARFTAELLCWSDPTMATAVRCAGVI